MELEHRPTQAVLRCEALIEQLADLADAAAPAVAIKAIRAQIRAAESQIALLQNAGIFPTPLSRIAYDRDAHRAASRAVEVINRHGVSAEAKAELISALRAPSRRGLGDCSWLDGPAATPE